jgi:ABC-type Na+ efflux pump permease subunit
LCWVFDLFQQRSAGREVFQSFSVFTFVYCLFVGATSSADCLSREKREGTLGLLFLTNLNSAEIVAGKLCANALSAFYSLLAILPLLALPVLMGGITLGHFWRTVLALLNALFFALSAGFVASAIAVRQFPAIALGTGAALVMGMGTLGAAEVLRRSGFATSTADLVAAFSPLHTLFAADDSVRVFNWGRFWVSLAAVAGMAWACLALVAWRIGRTWRDRPRNAGFFSRFGVVQRLRERGWAGRVALRRRLLGINPFFWLASRQRVSAPVFMLLTVILVLITVGITGPYFGRMMGTGVLSPVVGHLFAWFWSGLALHALVLYYGASVASQRLAEDKQTGALELILSTPTTEHTISRGLWLAYGRKMFFPALTAVLVHVYFLWLLAAAFVLEPPFKLPPEITPWQILWSTMLDQPINGFRLQWEIGFMFRVVLLALGVFMVTWIAVGWVGRWLGLRMKHPGFAPLLTVTLVLVPPVLLFSFICYVGEEFHAYRLPERQYLPILKWIAFGIGTGHCLLLSSWAAKRLRGDFRTTVTSRFQPPSLRRWWRPNPRVVLRFAVRAAALMLALVLVVLFLHAYQSRQGQRRWSAFQQQIEQRGESLDLKPSLPGPVAAEQNFVQTRIFQDFAHRRLANQPANALLGRLAQKGLLEPNLTAFSTVLAPWLQRGFSDFDTQLGWVAPNFKAPTVKDRTNSARTVLNTLLPLQADLAGLASATRLPFYQASTNRGIAVVFEANLREHLALEQLHYLFQLRAEAALTLDRPQEAGEDVMTSLRIAGLAKQSPDVAAPRRVQFLLARTLQPVWEGIVEHRWRDAQLAAFQIELTRFNLLADHTNAVGRVVRAYLEAWRAIPEGRTTGDALTQAGSVYVQGDVWALQPRVWWYDNCIQLYEAGRKAIARVDVARECVSGEYDWSDFSGLPLDSDSNALLQQTPWWGSSPAAVAFAQTAVNQAIIACALERYRLALGEYPESLEPLLPGYLARIPPDIMRGKPMSYQRVDKGTFILRSAGSNGVIEQSKKAGDDWLWTFPSATNAVTSSATSGN